jgi:hypothetical protein
MALTLTFVGYTPNRAIYQITSNSGGSGTLPNQGGATPDLSTDIPAGTPLGDYLRHAVANDAAAKSALQLTTRAKVAVQSVETNDPGYFTVEARRNATSGLPELILEGNPQTADVQGVLEIELFHTIAK